MTPIKDFQDFNYERIAFDINGMDVESKKSLIDKLHLDGVNKLHRIAMGDYFAIWNSDLQNFTSVDDIYFDSFEHDYKLAYLRLSIEGEWFYKVVEEREVCDNLWLI